MEHNPRTPNPLFIAVRHGERADEVPDPKVTYELSIDPCLTTIGLQQAFDTGVFLKKHFDLGNRNVYIYSSPLLRVMQSAAQLMRGVGIDKSHKLKVKNHLIEELYTQHFPINPVKNCLTNTKTHDYIKDKVLGGIEYEGDSTSLKFPENVKQTQARCWEGFDQFIKAHKDDKNAAVILVGHGRILDEFNDYFSSNPTCGPPYSAVSAAEFIKEGKYHTLMINYADHLSP